MPQEGARTQPPPGSLEKRNELKDKYLRACHARKVTKWSPHVRASLEKFFEK